MTRSDNIVRRQLLKAGLIVAGVEFCPEALFDRRAAADDKKEMLIGAREIVKGLDGMSRVAEKGGVFGLGHSAAALSVERCSPAGGAGSALPVPQASPREAFPGQRHS